MFRESLEAFIVVAVLLSLVEAIVVKTDTPGTTVTSTPPETGSKEKVDETHDDSEDSKDARQATLVRKLRIQVSRKIARQSCG